MSEELTVDLAMSQRFELVEKIAIIQGRHKAELEPLLEVVNLCEAFIKDEMNKGNMQSFKSAGTGHQAYFTTKDSVKMVDWDAYVGTVLSAAEIPSTIGSLVFHPAEWQEVLNYIHSHAAWDLLNHAANKTAVKERIEANKAPPPGVEYSSFKDLAWRRGKGA